MTAIDIKLTWVLSQGRLEQQGCRFRYSSGKGGSWLVTPGGLNIRLGRDSSRMPYLHGTFHGPGVFVACQPEDPNSVALLVGTGTAIHVAGALWRTRLKTPPSICVSTRAVGGGVSASLGQAALLIDFTEATGVLPTDLELSGTGPVSFPATAIATVCAGPVEWPPELGPFVAPVQVNLVSGADPPTTSPPSGKTPRGGARSRSPRGPAKAKERHISRSPPLRSHEVVAERLGFTNRDVLSRSLAFLTGVGSFAVPACYEPLDETVCLFAVAQRKIMKP